MYLAGGNYDAYTNPQSSFGGGRNPMRQDSPPIRGGGQFGQIVDTVGGGQLAQFGQVSGPSLGEMLSQRGFEMPKMKTGAEPSIALMYKDPITGKMKSGGPNAASHAKAMSDFYGKNPDALNIAKQHQQDQQYNPGGGRDRFNASQIMTGGQSGKEQGGGRGLYQGPLGPPQEIMPQPFQPANQDMRQWARSQPASQLRTHAMKLGNLTPTPGGPLDTQQIGGHQDAQIGMQFNPLVAASLPSPPRITNEQDFNRPSNMFKPNPYSAPPQMGGGFGGQMGGGMGGGQGMGQFMQFMQQMMQMFQQIQGGGGRGMGGGFQGPSQFMPQQQQYGQYQPQRNQYQQNQFMPQQQQYGQHQAQPAQFQPQRMSNQFNPNNAFGGY